ncbi:MAG TPA: membrane lipoprotein lipid attachment site-containing protein [Mucilaginibacter sp.]|nr:membrane lipoprotein lipid attachment site-containing protein [Mucilaginibacter sp.]
MKKILFILFAAAVIAGCQKDTGTTVNITSSDIAAINNQLKGAWVFPVQTMSIVDSAGKQLAANQYRTGPAFHFDGSSHVIMMSTLTINKSGIYTLSTNKGYIYLNITFSDATVAKYQILQADGSTLKLSSLQPTTYLNGGNVIAANCLTNISLQKQNNADLTASLVRVKVISDSSFNAGVYVTHNVAFPADTPTTLGTTVQNTTGSFTYSFVGHSGDVLKVDVFGSIPKTTFCAYYNGMPIDGKLDTNYNEIVTGNGWRIP